MQVVNNSILCGFCIDFTVLLLLLLDAFEFCGFFQSSLELLKCIA